MSMDLEASGTQNVRVAEILNVFTTLGIRFWDPVLDVQVRGGLRVEAWPEKAPRSRRRAVRGRSDVYAFHALPGLRDLEYDPSKMSEGSPPAPRQYIVQVVDERRRYLPAAFRVELPLPYRGVFPGANGQTPPGFFLYSAPTRPSVSWLAVVRGELAEESTGKPAAHAVVKVSVDGLAPQEGLADEAGRFAVFMAPPKLEITLQNGSPPSPPTAITALSERSWPLEVRVAWQKSKLASASLPGTPLANYGDVLDQADGKVFEKSPDNGGQPAAVWQDELAWGREKIVTTQGLSRLLVSSAV